MKRRTSALNFHGLLNYKFYAIFYVKFCNFSTPIRLLISRQESDTGNTTFPANFPGKTRAILLTTAITANRAMCTWSARKRGRWPNFQEMMRQDRFHESKFYRIFCYVL